MDAELVRQHAQAYCDALLAGDVDKAVEDFSDELRAHIGQLISQIPLPLTEATVESVEAGGTAHLAMLLLVGENETVRLETRWKDRDGRPTIVEASHVTEATEPPPEAAEPLAEA
ncbi:MAG: hypothetical protein ABIP53_10120 [Candidatus Limnocylindrales bacterium]